MTTKTVRGIVELPPELHYAFKVACCTRRTTMQAELRRFVESFVDTDNVNTAA